MVKQAGAETLAFGVWQELRSDIFGRRLAPGERLKPNDLCRRFGVSVSVVREGLGMLTAQNLVVMEPNHGYHVVRLSPQALEDLTVARKVTEGGALRISVAQGDLTWESNVLASHHRMASLPVFLPDREGVRNEEWISAHLRFHYALIEACGNALLLGICSQLSDSAELYRAWSAGGKDGNRNVAREHKELMQSALDHDPDGAVRLFEQHVDRTARLVLRLNEPDIVGSNAG